MVYAQLSVLDGNGMESTITMPDALSIMRGIARMHGTALGAAPGATLLALAIEDASGERTAIVGTEGTEGTVPRGYAATMTYGEAIDLAVRRKTLHTTHQVPLKIIAHFGYKPFNTKELDGMVVAIREAIILDKRLPRTPQFWVWGDRTLTMMAVHTHMHTSPIEHGGSPLAFTLGVTDKPEIGDVEWEIFPDGHVVLSNMYYMQDIVQSRRLRIVDFGYILDKLATLYPPYGQSLSLLNATYTLFKLDTEMQRTRWPMFVFLLLEAAIYPERMGVTASMYNKLLAGSAYVRVTPHEDDEWQDKLTYGMLMEKATEKEVSRLTGGTTGTQQRLEDMKLAMGTQRVEQIMNELKRSAAQLTPYSRTQFQWLMSNIQEWVGGITEPRRLRLMEFIRRQKEHSLTCPTYKGEAAQDLAAFKEDVPFVDVPFMDMRDVTETYRRCAEGIREEGNRKRKASTDGTGGGGDSARPRAGGAALEALELYIERLRF